MNNALVAGQKFHGLHPFVFGEIRFDLEVLNVIRRVGFQREGFFHREDGIGFANAPAFGELWHGRQVFRIAFLRAAVHPGHDRVNFFLGQARVIREMIL